jgi:histidinol phosphatase-like enzyme (inositol monophosphatase family)
LFRVLAERANVSHENPISERLEFAVAIAREAGDGTLRYFRRQDLNVERKADQSPVTVADRDAEQLLRERIGEQFPGDGIIGEEFGTHGGTTDYRWVLDPIDGTKSFIHGVPLYTTLVAVLKGDDPVIGVIHAPAVGETVYAAKGAGCWYLSGSSTEPQRVRVSEVAQLREGLLVTTELESFKKNARPDALEVFLRLQQASRVARTWGDGYGYLMVATGRAEVMIDPIVNLWDAAPLLTIIEEAGGWFGDWQGNSTIHAGEAIATNARVAEEVLAMLKTAG